MACGVPVAALPVPGPQDLIVDGANGALDENLRDAVFRALAVAPEDCVEHAQQHSWEASTRCFLDGLVAARSQPAASMTVRRTGPLADPTG